MWQELQGTNSQSALLFHTGRTARCWNTAPVQDWDSAQAVVRAGLKRGWLAGSRNTSHVFRLWKAVKPAGKSELISSIKTWLYLFELTLQYIKAHPSKPQGNSLLYHYAQWERGAVGKVWRKLAKQQELIYWLPQHKAQWHCPVLTARTDTSCPVPAQGSSSSPHLEGHSLSSCKTCKLQEFKMPPGSSSNALKWHWSHRTNEFGSFPPKINFHFSFPALFRLGSSPLSFPLPPLILYQNGSRTN